MSVVEFAGPHGFDVEVRGESFHMRDVLAAAHAGPCEVADDRMRSEIMVRLQREPHNQYDANAIVVLSMSGNELGHVARETAARYAPVFDRFAGLGALECSACVFGRNVDGVGWRAGVWIALPTLKSLSAQGERASASRQR